MQQKTGFNFCPSCGSNALTGHQKSVTCTKCNYNYYHNCAGATAGIITRGEELLIIERKFDPGKGLFGLPGGFVDYGETLEESFLREMKEELNIVPKHIKYFASFPNIYKYNEVTYHTIDAYFSAQIDDTQTIIPADDAADYQWVKFNNIDIEQFAFESAKKAIWKLINKD